MEKIKLNKRKVVGKKTKKLRDENVIPGVIYNSSGESINVSIDRGVAVQLYKTATPTTILEVEISKKSKKAIVKDIDIDPRTDRILHVSLFEVDPKDKIDFTIPFTLKGVAPAVKNSIGILVQVNDGIDVRCKLDDLISEIEVDVTNLEHPGQTITMEDIELPDGLEIIHKDDKNIPIATITQLQKLEILEETKEEDDEDEEGEDGEEGEEGEKVAEGEEGEKSAEGQEEKKEGENQQETTPEQSRTQENPQS
jgi:large subunit ribosomal protein L25